MSNELKICTTSFSYSDCLLLIHVLHSNFGLKATIQSTGVSSQHIIILEESIDELRNLVAAHILPSMINRLLPPISFAAARVASVSIEQRRSYSTSTQRRMK